MSPKRCSRVRCDTTAAGLWCAITSSPGAVLDLRDLEVPLPRRAGLLLEKLLTERVAEKGARDLLVVVGLLVVMRVRFRRARRRVRPTGLSSVMLFART